MKIFVTKEAKEQRLQKAIDLAVKQAIETANEGRPWFHFDTTAHRGIDTYNITRGVEKATEGTVFAGHRSVHHNYIDFSIKSE